MNDCIVFQGAKNKKGYGCVNVNGKMKKAHRVAWEAVHGPIPKGLFVCHRCDNPACVNVEHLFLGTNADNMRDCKEKGRIASRKNGRNACAQKTHCPHGHEYKPENTRINKRGCRECKACKSVHNAYWNNLYRQKGLANADSST